MISHMGRLFFYTGKKPVIIGGELYMACSVTEAVRSDDPSRVEPGSSCMEVGYSGHSAMTPMARPFKASIERVGGIPSTWRISSRKIFIPKPGRGATLEKLVDNYIQDMVIKTRTLILNRHAYRTGKACETALPTLLA